MKYSLDLLLNEPENIGKIPELYQFDIVLIPKKDLVSLRVISQGESILNIFHKIILEDIKPLLKKKISSHQHALDAFGREKCMVEAR